MYTILAVVSCSQSIAIVHLYPGASCSAIAIVYLGILVEQDGYEDSMPTSSKRDTSSISIGGQVGASTIATRPFQSQGDSSSIIHWPSLPSTSSCYIP